MENDEKNGSNFERKTARAIIMLPVPEVRPYEKNPRKNADAVKYVKASIEKFGFKQPIIVDSNRVIIAGHTRLEAAKSLGMAEVPCIVADDLTDAQVKALRLADNKVAEFSEWEMNLLGEELGELAEISDIDMGDFGFDLSEFDNIGLDDEETEVVEDEVPEEVEPVCKKGELWQLGEHRLMCGDSTDADAVSKLMNGERADLCFTDPPYGMKKESEGVLNDNLNYDDLLEFNKQWIPLTFANLKDNGSWYCWGIDEPLMDIYANILKPMIKRREICFRNLITWDKGNGQGQTSEEFRMYPIADEKCLFVMVGWEAVQCFTVNSCDYSPVMEPLRSYLEGEIKRLGENDETIAIALGWKCRRTVNHWYSKSQFALPTKENYEALRAYGIEKIGDADFLKREYDSLKREFYAGRSYFDNTHDNMNNVWHFARTRGEEREDAGGHATPKPIALCARGIKTSSREGEIVLDIFGGSGSTMIACEQLGRKCRMMELDPHYCTVIIARWEKLTGQKAVKLNP